jgi:hypothetical protein
MQKEDNISKTTSDISLENKYFTPSIEDIRVGYEFEAFLANPKKKDKQWKSQVYENKWVDNYLDFEYMLKQGRIRVPYLTKEQIEKEGWKYYSTLSEGDGELKDSTTTAYVYKKDGFTCRFSVVDRTISLYAKPINNDEWWIRIIFRGECKDINTFRYICKLLGI